MPLVVCCLKLPFRDTKFWTTITVYSVYVAELKMLTTEKEKQGKRHLIKKTVMLVLLLLCALCLSILCACGKTSNIITPNKEEDSGNSDDSTGHTHNFCEIIDNKYLIEEANCQHGNIYYMFCECGEMAKDTFDDGKKTEHKYEKSQKSSADCENPNVYYMCCADCGEANYDLTFTDGKALGHSYQELPSDNCLLSSANCENAAVYYKSCERCGVKSSETFTYGKPSGNHNYIEVVDKNYLFTEATCENYPVYYKKCSICGASSGFDTGEIFEDTTATKGEHSFHNERTEKKYLKESATCTHGNIYYYSCEYCTTSSKDITNDTFDDWQTVDHDYIENATEETKYSDATCTEPATYYKTCSMCGEKSWETFTYGNALGHNFVEEKSADYIETFATCTQKAVYYKHCTRCDATGETFEGDMLPHTFTRQETTKDTLKSKGNCQTKSVYYCTCANCSAISDTETFEYVYGSHDYQDIVDESNLIQAAECLRGAFYYKKCAVCGERAEENNYSIYTFTTAALGHHFVEYTPAYTYDGLATEATCETPAKYYKKCDRSNCNAYATDEDTFEYGEPLGHNMWDTYHYKATLSDTNYITSECQRDNCSHTETKSLIVPENSNIYNFIFDSSIYQEGTTLYCKIIGYKTFYGDDRDKNLVVPETWSGAEIRYLSISGENNTVETITLNNTMETCHVGSFNALKRVVSNHEASIDVGINVPKCFTCSGTIETYKGHGSPAIEFYDYVEEKTNADYEYVLCKNADGYYISIKKYLGSSELVEIPETIDGYPVKYLAARSFESTTIKKIIVPTCVETAVKPFGNDPSNYYGTMSLERVYMKGQNCPDGWNDIYNGTWQANTRSYLYYYGVKKVGTHKRTSLISFDYIIYNDGTIDKAMIDRVILTESESESASDFYFTQPDAIEGVDVTVIGTNAFKDETLLRNITMSKIVEIKDNAFYGCSNLITATFSEALETIGDYAFYGCNRLTSVMGTATTSSTTGETTVPGSTAGVKSIGNYAFYGCKLAEFTFGDNLVSIGDYAFQYNALAKVVIPDSLESLGEYAFSDNEIQVLDFGSNTKLHTIPKGAFAYNKIIDTKVIDSETVFEIPSSVYTIEAYAFINNEISDLIVNSLNIGDYAFAECTKLTRVRISYNMDNIGKNPFKNCCNLGVIKVSNNSAAPKYMSGYEPDSTSAILNEMNCIYEVATNTIVVGCKNTVFEDFITGIGEDAFNGMGVEYIYIPKTVTSFGAKSLYDIEHIYLESETNTLTETEAKYYGSTLTGIYKIYEATNGIVYAIYKNNDEYTASVVYAKVGGKVQILTYIQIDTWTKAYVTKINDYVFSGQDISEIRLASADNCHYEDTKLAEIGEGAFKNCGTIIVSCWTTSIKTVGKDAFSGTTVSMIRFYEVENGKGFDAVESMGEGNETLTGVSSSWYYSKDDPMPDLFP